MTRCISLGPAELKRHPLPPVEEADKDTRGRLLLIAGSRDLPGAALLAAIAALRAGAGKLQVATTESAAAQLGVTIPEAMVKGFPEARDGGLARSAISPLVEMAGDVDAVMAGPGMMVSKTGERLVADLCGCGTPLVLDAALLRVLPARDKDARESPGWPILLPHSGELAALLEREQGDVESDPLGAGLNCAKRYDALVLVKGVQSHIVAPDGGTWKYEGGGPGLGISGSGDTLAGIIGGLLARGAEPLTALLWGVWLHGEAGASLSGKVGKVGFLAREIAGEIPALLPGNQPSLE